MIITGTRDTPGSIVYSVICTCGYPFETPAWNRGMVKCPRCNQVDDIRKMVQHWKETPKERFARLIEIYAEARALQAEYLKIPELDEKYRDQREEMENRLDKYYTEAKDIMAAFGWKRRAK